MSRVTEIIKFLQNYNAWRRGDETLEMPHPAEIGKNIQDAIVLLRKNAELEAELAVERARLDSGQIMLIVAGERIWHCGVDLRAAIDAAIWRAEARSSIRHFLNTTQ